MANNLGGVGQLNIEGNINRSNTGLNETKKMNRTSVGFRPMKQTYEEKLDNFMAQNNLKYIEPQKAEKKPLQVNQSQPELIKPRRYNVHVSSLGNTPTIDWSNNLPSINAPVNFDERIIGIPIPFLK